MHNKKMQNSARAWKSSDLWRFSPFSKKNFLGRKYNFHDVDLEIFDLKDFTEVHTFNDSTKEFLKRNPSLSNLGAWGDVVETDFINQKIRTTAVILDYLIGVRGMSKPTVQEALAYVDYFNKSQFFKWNLRKLFKDFKNHNLKFADLGSVCDVTILSQLITGFEKPKVMEIGGGYGRLAQSFVSNQTSLIDWYLVDVVPSSLAFAVNFLKKSGINTNFHQDITSESTVNILSAKDLNLIPENSVSIVINIESFQEMTQEWVDFWVSQINQKTRSGSFFYHSNAFDYKNKFHLNLGTDWEKIDEIRHPRHWSESHRTEIFVRE